MARDTSAMPKSNHIKSLLQRWRDDALSFLHWQERALPQVSFPAVLHEDIRKLSCGISILYIFSCLHSAAQTLVECY